MSRRLVTMPELVAELHISPRAGARLVARGCPVYRFGRSVRFDIDEVRQWVREHPRGGQPTPEARRHGRPRTTIGEVGDSR